MTTQGDRSFVIPSDEGDVVKLPMGGVGVQFKIDGDRTGGSVSIVEHPVPAGAFALPHTHHREDEISYVLEGRIAAEIDGHEMVVEAGEYLLKPRGLKHAFWNPSDAPARILEVIAPAGLERFFRMAGALRLDAAGDREGARALLTEIGVETHFDEAEPFLARHQLESTVPLPVLAARMGSKEER
jgi:mannose-6-phosphate isomerase-like protein (cupin superfamily)